MSLPNYDQEETVDRYLVYSLGGELYGSPLLSVKEVVKKVDLKPVPYMKNYFKGVMNLRGAIISVIDLREKFQQNKNSDNAFILVFDLDNRTLGAIVDNVESVETFEEGEIDHNPMVEMTIPDEFLIGVAKKQDKLINLVDVTKCLSVDDMRLIKKED